MNNVTATAVIEMGHFRQFKFVVSIPLLLAFLRSMHRPYGTLIAAHAFAEAHLDVAAHNRSFGLTEAEYEESEEILRGSHVALLEKFPVTPAERIAVEGSNACCADIIRQGKESMRRKLLNFPVTTMSLGR